MTPTQHPNALATFKTSVISGIASAVAVWVNSRWGFHITTTEAVGAAVTIVGLASTARLYVGQRGLLPVLKGLWGKYITGTVPAVKK